MSDHLPVVFDYIDFRKYLEDYRKARASNDEGFTHCYICHRLGMKNSRSYFNNIIRGRKNISADTIHKLILLMDLGANEADYFRALVNYNQTKQPEEKKYYFDQIIRLNNTPRKFIDGATYEYFSTWYHPVIRELLDTFDFSDNYRELARKVRPPVTGKQARESIALLKRLNLIEKNKNGFLKPNGKVVSTPDNAQAPLVEQYQLLSLERARDRIVNNANGHKTTTMTIAVSPKGLEQVLEHLAQVRSAIRSIAHKDDQTGKKVYEVILHMHTQSQ